MKYLVESRTSREDRWSSANVVPAHVGGGSNEGDLVGHGDRESGAVGAATFDSEGDAVAAIASLRQLGDDWAGAEYRVRPVSDRET